MILGLLALYTLITFYFLFIGFQRASSDQGQGMRYNFIPEGIPLHFPIGRDFQIWFFELGNFVAFIPFGIVIPLLFRCSFLRFLSLFLLCITTLETLQMISRLGAFDVDDIIINTLGAAVGYWSQRLVTRHRDTWKGMIRIILTAAIMSVGTIAVIGGINHYVDHGGGETVALNELVVQDGSVLWDESLAGFSAGQTEVEPQINLYSRNNAKNNEFSYLLNGKYARMEGSVAIPDVDGYTASNGRSAITFIADGTEMYSLEYTSLDSSVNSGEARLDSFQIPLHGVNELTIKVMNDGPNPFTNVVMWDITITEVNTGQMLINNMKSLFYR